MDFENIPVPADSQDQQAIDELARAIKKAKKSVYISSFGGSDRGDNIRAAVEQAPQ